MKTDLPRPIYLKDYTAPAFLISETELDFALSPHETRVISRLKLSPNPETKGKAKTLVLDGEHMTLVRVALDGQELPASAYTLTDESLTLKQVPGKPFQLEIETICDPEANKALEGLFRTQNVYCTQCEPNGFRRITYYLDRPDVLAKFKVRIEASKKEAPLLLSNGNLIESGDLKGGKHFAVWEDPFAKPAYLFALVAGNLACVKDTFKTKSKRKIDLRIYVEPGKEDRCDWAMESLKRSMAWDEERFGLEYDLDIFMIVAVSDFNMGAMENKGLNVFNDALILARPDTATDTDYERIEAVIAHEYFHNWTGNRVTCRDWFQLCLKEGLTVFRDQEFTADVRSAVVKRIQDVRLLKRTQFPEDAGPLAHPVRPAFFIEINNFYTRTVYEKGAELCRMLQTVLGRKEFKKGLDLYFKRHDGQAVTVEDFISAMGDANKQDLSAFLLWYNQAGTPELEAKFTYSEATKTAKLALAQSYPPLSGEANEKRKAVPIPVKLGLVSMSGKNMPLKVEGKKLGDDFILLRKKKEVITFDGLNERPVPSLLRDFSAPVTLNTALNERDMLTLLRADSDLFNRWQTAQAFALKHLVDLTKAIQQGETPKANTRFVAALGEVAQDDKLEHAYRAAFLTLPGEHDVALAIGQDVDPEAIFEARKILRTALGRSLRKVLEQVWETSAPAEPYRPDADSAGRRALRNAALGLLVAGESRFAFAKVKSQAQHATNMTDSIAALSILSTTEDAAYETALQRFKRKWKNEMLVMNKWFQVQALSSHESVFAHVEELAADPLFFNKNPNQLRSLYGAFAHSNLVRFNDGSGKGYQLVSNAVLAIDDFNPQVAAKLMVAFESWRMFDKKRQKHAEACLRKILKSKALSRDVFEIASKILGAEKEV